MHGLINRSIECFVRDIYGLDQWQQIAAASEIGFDSFEPLLVYEDELTARVLDAAALNLGKPVEIILEDLGTYLVSHPNVQSLSRLLRFGGETFTDFLHSLADIQDRARMAVPELEMPMLSLRSHIYGNFTLYCSDGYPGIGHVLVGMLRAMADEYGALVLLEHLGGRSEVEAISVQVMETRFSEGSIFKLGRADA